MKQVLIGFGKNEIPNELFKETKELLTHFNFKILSEDRKSSFFIWTVLGQSELKLALMNLSQKFQFDLTLIPEDLYSTPKKLVVLDMDSTLIQAEVIDEMAVIHGIGDKVKMITERAMNGEINFDQSLKERVSLLKGFKKERMSEILQGLKLTEGTAEFLQTLQKQGIKTAIASGGFSYFAENLMHKLGMDYAFSNELDFEQDLLTGKVSGEIVNAEKKAEILGFLAQKERIKIEQVVAIGDGANDLLMLKKAGLGVAIHAKEKVRKESPFQLSYSPMTGVLHLMGIHNEAL